MRTRAGVLYKSLEWVERAGNALPHPALLFVFLALAVVAGSALVAGLGVEAVHPVKKNLIQPVNLLSAAGLQLTISGMVKNYAGFAPLGTVLVAILGFSVAEKSGLIGALLRLLVLKAPRALLTPAVLLGGVVSHTAGDVGYVLLIPLAAMAYHSAGMNPLAGLAVCFAGVSGGFAANFLLSTADPLLSGISQEAARLLDPSYVVLPVVNWYFMAASSLLIVGVGTLIAERVTIPFLGPYAGAVESVRPEPLSAAERRGLRWAFATFAALTALLLWGLVPESGFLRDPKHPDILHSPALKGVVAVIFIFGVACGLAYGIPAGVYRKHGDVIDAMQDAVAKLAPYLVLVFFASQFIALFDHSKVGLILAVHGSELLKSLGLGTVPLMIGFILLTCVLDLFIGSASAKWALMAPVFVPMFMLVGTAPELAQASYRIGDSVINIVSPLMSYFPLILAFVNKYDPKAKVGTLLALMLPYSLGFLFFWSLLLFGWVTLDLPLGPSANMRYVLPQ